MSEQELKVRLEAGTAAEAMEKYCLLACFPWRAQFVFLYTLGRPTYLEVTTYGGLGPPRHSWASLIFSIEHSSFVMLSPAPAPQSTSTIILFS